MQIRNHGRARGGWKKEERMEDVNKERKDGKKEGREEGKRKERKYLLMVAQLINKGIES